MLHNKYIFLDIDGVLNTHDLDPETACGRIHRDKVDRLNRILRATGALIVLSSAWRYIVHRGEANIRGMEWLLRSHGVIAGRLAGVTRLDTMMPTLWDGKPASWPKENERGAQIADFLTDWPLVEAYVVIDDLDPGISAAGHPFVQTDGAIGLTDEQADRAIALLCGGADVVALVSADTLFEAIAERVASARTKALMGNRDEARALLASARADYERYRAVLPRVAGVLALEHSLETAEETMMLSVPASSAGTSDSDKETLDA